MINLNVPNEPYSYYVVVMARSDGTTFLLDYGRRYTHDGALDRTWERQRNHRGDHWAKVNHILRVVPK
jgi:hypothetical protein